MDDMWHRQLLKKKRHSDNCTSIERNEVFTLCMNNISLCMSHGWTCQVFFFLSALVFISKPFMPWKIFLYCFGPSGNDCDTHFSPIYYI